MIAQSKLVLHDAIFLSTCFAILENEIHCKLQKTCYTLQSRVATCNLFNTTFHAIVAESRTEFYPVAIVASLKKLREKLQRFDNMLHAATYLQLFSEHHYKTSCKENSPFLDLNSTSCNDFRDFLKPLQVAGRFLFPKLRDKLQGKLHRVTLT